MRRKGGIWRVSFRRRETDVCHTDSPSSRQVDHARTRRAFSRKRAARLQSPSVALASARRAETQIRRATYVCRDSCEPRKHFITPSVTVSCEGVENGVIFARHSPRFALSRVLLVRTLEFARASQRYAQSVRLAGPHQQKQLQSTSPRQFAYRFLTWTPLFSPSV